MNLTNTKYLFDLMEREKFQFFSVYNASGAIMRDQCDENYSVADAMEDLRHFLEFNSGVFRVEFRKTKNNTAQTKNYSFTIDNFKEVAKDSTPMMGLNGGIAGGELMGVIQQKDEKIDKLQSEMFAQVIGSLQKQHELQMEVFKNSMNKDTGNEALLQAALAAISGMFGGGQNIALSGLEEVQETQEKPLVDDKRKKINNAVVRLMKADMNFAENITKLADMADQQPMIYSMAIEKLRNL